MRDVTVTERLDYVSWSLAVVAARRAMAFIVSDFLLFASTRGWLLVRPPLPCGCGMRVLPCTVFLGKGNL